MKDNTKMNTALYIRLSREDGDKAESLSVGNQRLFLMEYLEHHKELVLFDEYVDDGYSGTNFDRPNFQRMLEDIEAGKIQCVLVKDMSRLGRHMAHNSEFINEYFPYKRVRFIAVAEGIDKQISDWDANEDLTIDMLNLINSLYPRDIAKKVRATFRAKQANGQFVGAFASYGYVKAKNDHNKLEIDEYAAGIVRRIFEMYLRGMGQNTIAKALNDEGILCPSEYKKQCGLSYRNSNRLKSTTYWTYSSIRRILTSEMYIGNMVQNKAIRQPCKKHAAILPREKWIVVQNTHPPIIDGATWDRVQDLLQRNTRHTSLNQNIHLFAGYLKCGDCERAMVKIRRQGTTYYNCGSYNRFGKSHCSIHSISEQQLEDIVLTDLNLIINSVQNLQAIIDQEQEQCKAESARTLGDVSAYRRDIERMQNKLEKAYEDYSDDLISRDQYLRYKENYERQIYAAQSKIEATNRMLDEGTAAVNPWIAKLLAKEPLDHLDRSIVIEMISMIYIYENRKVKIVYNFSDELEAVLVAGKKIQQDTVKLVPST